MVREKSVIDAFVLIAAESRGSVIRDQRHSACDLSGERDCLCTAGRYACKVWRVCSLVASSLVMKRVAEPDEDPLAAVEKESEQHVQEEAKRARKLEFEQLYASALPSAQMYERSFMHRDTVTHTATSKAHFIITASSDGHVKFWKKVNLSTRILRD